MFYLAKSVNEVWESIPKLLPRKAPALVVLLKQPRIMRKLSGRKPRKVSGIKPSQARRKSASSREILASRSPKRLDM